MRSYSGWAPAPGSLARNNWPLPPLGVVALHRPSLAGGGALPWASWSKVGPAAAGRVCRRWWPSGWWCGGAAASTFHRVCGPGAGGPVALVLGLRGPVAHRDDAVGMGGRFNGDRYVPGL